MTHEKIIKRDDVEYRISASASITSYYGKDIIYDVSTHVRERGRRKWMDIPESLSDYEYRCLSMEDRRTHDYENMLRFVTKKEIFEAKIELWDKLKPNK